MYVELADLSQPRRLLYLQQVCNPIIRNHFRARATCNSFFASVINIQFKLAIQVNTSKVVILQKSSMYALAQLYLANNKTVFILNYIPV